MRVVLLKEGFHIFYLLSEVGYFLLVVLNFLNVSVDRGLPVYLIYGMVRLHIGNDLVLLLEPSLQILNSVHHLGVILTSHALKVVLLHSSAHLLHLLLARFNFSFSSPNPFLVKKIEFLLGRKFDAFLQQVLVSSSEYRLDVFVRGL